MAKRHSNRVGNLESLFLRLKELVLANSGEDEFEEVFKLLIAKLWDERTQGGTRFTPKQTPEETLSEIDGLLREAERAWTGILEPGSTPALTPEHLQVCVDALSSHTISGNSFEVMDALFEFLVATGSKGAKGQYFTPRYVIELCVRMLNPQKEETVLDPACGSGGFLIHALNHVRGASGLKSAALRDYSSTKLWGFDIDSRATRVAKALMVLAGDGHANIFRLNSLAHAEATDLFQVQRNSSETPFLTIEDVCRSRLRRHKGFDVILTNPPFAGEVREPELLRHYDLAMKKQRVERDVLFVERCVDLLCPGGRMAIVVPHNKVGADSFEYVRKWLLRKCRVLAVVGLPRNTFLPHTHQKASVLFLKKRKGGSASQGDEEVFFAVSEKDAKNSKGELLLRPNCQKAESLWERVDHDFDEIVAQFHAFRKR